MLEQEIIKEKKEILKKYKNRKVHFVQNELCESIPRPTPLSLDLVRKMYEVGSSFDRAYNYFGLSYPKNFKAEEYIVTLFGNTYINLERGLELGKFFSLLKNSFSRLNLLASLEEVYRKYMVVFYKIKAPKLLNKIQQIKGEREVSFTYLNKLLALFYHGISTDSATIGLMVKLLQNRYRKECQQVNWFINREHFHLRLENQDVFNLIETNKYLVDYDLEISLPRKIFEANSKIEIRQSNKKDKQMRLINSAFVLREDIRKILLYQYNELRNYFLLLGNKFGLDDDIFYLKLNEIKFLLKTGEIKDIERLISKRKERLEKTKNIKLKTIIRQKDLLEILKGETFKAGEELKKFKVVVLSFGDARGRVRIVVTKSDFNKVKKGDIIVVRLLTPQLLPLFDKIEGIVSEVGSILSHLVIIAREKKSRVLAGLLMRLRYLKTAKI